MHWFDHFLTKLSKYLWIKAGDRHYHFVEPWVIDRPFCRMETVYQNHFVETGVGSLQNGAPQPPQGMGRRIKGVRKVQHSYVGVLRMQSLPSSPRCLWVKAFR